MRMRDAFRGLAVIGALVMLATTATAQVPPAGAAPDAPPTATSSPDALAATRPAGFPQIQIDRERRQVRVAAERIDVNMPLEFFAVRAGGPEHEAIFRTRALPSHIHAALLILGLEEGDPVRFSEATQSWIPPHGPPLQIRVAWDDGGRTVEVPAYRLMRHMRTKREMPPQTWIFAGSRVMDDGSYAADATGYVVTIVNFDFALIDVPQIASSENARLLWELNDAVAPPPGTKVTMILEPIMAGDPSTRPAAGDGSPLDHESGRDHPTRRSGGGEAGDATARPSGAAAGDGGRRTDAAEGGDGDAHVNGAAAGGGARLDRAGTRDSATRPDGAGGGGGERAAMDLASLRRRWEAAVAPHAGQLKAASQTHYEVIAALRAEQQRLIDDADRIQRLIDELDAAYQQLTTPRPAAPEAP